MKIRIFLVGLLIACFPFKSWGNTLSPIPPDQAFAFSATVINNHTLQLAWQIAAGYYLYQEGISYEILSPNNAYLSDALLPKPVLKTGVNAEQYAVYDTSFTINLPVSMPKAGPLSLDVNYQGCSSSGYCYPPQAKRISVDLRRVGSSHTGIDITPTLAPAPFAIPKIAAASVKRVTNTQDQVTQLLVTHNIFIVLVSFLGFGLLLAFTPCVLPMIPILSSIIVGRKQAMSAAKAFRISGVYVLSMATTYAVAGVLAGLAGSTLQATLQNPWVLASCSAVFVLLALSLFGLYEIQIPAALQRRFSLLSQRQQGGHYIGVVIMGCLATLIVSPCITPALIGALVYISQTGNAVLGGTALFALGVGMGIPLILLATFGGQLLPKAGAWMNTVKAGFGVLMLGVALGLIGRLLAGPLNLFLWGALLIMSAIYMGALESTRDRNGWYNFAKGIGIIIGFYGLLLIIGASMGNSHFWQPLKQVPLASTLRTSSPFTKHTIKTVADLKQVLATAKAAKVPVIVDFYADWCVECQFIEQQIFENTAMQQALKNIRVVQADVTANDAEDKALQAYLKVFAPPTLVFFNAQAEELTTLRMVGRVSTEDFKTRLVSLNAG